MEKFLSYLLLMFITTVSLTFTSCGDDSEDEPSLKFKDVSLSYEQTYTIPNGKNIKWESSNEYIVSVSGSTIKAERVGEAVIKSDKGSFKVTVTPTSFIFTEPCLEWNCNKTTVKSFMNKISSMSIKDDTSTTLSYTGTGKTLLYTYSFENNKLDGAGVSLNGDYVEADEMATFMIERYVPVSMEESTYSFYFVSPDKKTVAMMRLTTSGRNILYIVVYVPADSSSRGEYDINQIFKDYKFNSSSAITTDAFERIKNRF